MTSDTSKANKVDLVIIGAGGFAAELLWVAEDMGVWNIKGCVVYDPAKYPKEVYGYPVLGTPEEFAARYSGAVSFCCGIGDNNIREQQVGKAIALGWKPISLVHPSVVTAKGIEIGDGSYVAAGSILAPNARLGTHVIVNLHVSVGHDSVMGDFSQACPGVRIGGKCLIGRSVFLGSNATLGPGVEVGESAVVGANSFVRRSIGGGARVGGVPARPF